MEVGNRQTFDALTPGDEPGLSETFFFHPLQLLQTDSAVSLIQEQMDSSSNLSESSNENLSPSSHSMTPLLFPSMS